MNVKLDMKPNRITTAEDNLGQPVFWQTPCYAFALLSTVVLIVGRGFGSVCKQHSFTKG